MRTARWRDTGRWWCSFLAATAATALATAAGAQQPSGGPLPPLPPSGPEQGSGAGSGAAPAPPPPASGQPAGEAAPPADATQDPGVVYEQEPPPLAAPPPVEYVEPPVPKHAPKYSLYVGGFAGAIGYGGNFYDNENNRPETTGNFLKPGVGLELDVGARLGYRYIPFLLLEHGFMGQGHRFDGTDTTAASDFLGIGLRYVAADVDTVGVVTEISFGMRQVSLHDGNGESYKMTGFEFFRFGLGAEIRLSTLFVITPMAHFADGAMTDSDGDITFGPNGSKDGITHPTYRNGATIDTGRSYFILGVGCGGHFDFFGK